MIQLHLIIFILAMKKALLHFLSFLGLLSTNEYAIRKQGLKKTQKKVFLAAQQKKLDAISKKYWKHKEQRGATNRAVYTCITGGYDILQQHEHIDFNWDYICFCDDPRLLALGAISVWEIRPLAFMELDSVRNARWHKIHPQQILQDYEYSLWCDGNITIIDRRIFQRLEALAATDTFLSIAKHPSRECIYDEIDACIAQQKDDPASMQALEKEVLKPAGYPKGYGLYATGIIFRKHTVPQCSTIMTEWWLLIKNFSRRDQLSCNFVLWKNQVCIPDLLEVPLTKSPYIKIHYLPSSHVPSVTKVVNP